MSTTKEGGRMSDRQRGRGIGLVTLAVGRRGARRRRGGVCGRHEAGGVRRRDPERELVGRLDGERLRRQERPREAAQVQGQGDEHHRGPAELPGDGRRQDRRRARGLGQHARPVEQEVRDEQGESSRSAATGSPASSAGTSPATCSSSTRSSRRGRGSRARRASSRRPSRRRTQGRSSAATRRTSRRTGRSSRSSAST